MADDPTERLLAMWSDDLLPWLGELMRDGVEGALLEVIAPHPRAARLCMERARASDHHTERKLAAILAGRAGTGVPESTLDQMFEAEAERDRALASNDFERLSCQSVVEDVVFAATRWCRIDARRDAGLSLLRKVVERTLEGQYWNTASYAMAGLMHHDPGAESTALLARFSELANGKAPTHPSRPSLEMERSFARELEAGNPAAVSSIESLLDETDKAASEVTWDERARALLKELSKITAAVG